MSAKWPQGIKTATKQIQAFEFLRVSIQTNFCSESMGVWMSDMLCKGRNRTYTLAKDIFTDVFYHTCSDELVTYSTIYKYTFVSSILQIMAGR